MTKAQAEAILNEIHIRDANKVHIEQGLQLAVDTYVENLLKKDPKLNWSTILHQFDRKTDNLTRAFLHAMRHKWKKIRSIKENQAIPKETKTEEKFILSEVCKMLEMTPQNLNHLLRKHTDIKVIEVSARKRYMTKSEIAKVKKIGRK